MIDIWKQVKALLVNAKRTSLVEIVYGRGKA